MLLGGGQASEQQLKELVGTLQHLHLAACKDEDEGGCGGSGWARQSGGSVGGGGISAVNAGLGQPVEWRDTALHSKRTVQRERPGAALRERAQQVAKPVVHRVILRTLWSMHASPTAWITSSDTQEVPMQRQRVHRGAGQEQDLRLLASALSKSRHEFSLA